MPQHQTTRTVSHSAQQMFELVSDVEKYPQFVPLCESLRVRERTAKDDGQTILLADMTVAYSFFRETFTSRVTLDPANLTILVEYITGPFSSLQNRWKFVPLDEHKSEVDFFIRWEMRSRTIGLVVGAVFERAFRRFASAFEARANRVYGRTNLGGVAT
ncbi:type II toxin-antitoxin system RatA family toxin [Terrihabitans sp. B22-R8]|uniref:type II toxin-antitoxin system RatA family toxin n=1 Tax=Terrihabitans sp. B22-R8 TaxID=3425128 RepID=UPI00403C5762